MKYSTNQQGQALIEFVLLLVVVMGLSFGMKRVAMSKIGDIWKSMIDTIAYPSKTKFR